MRDNLEKTHTSKDPAITVLLCSIRQTCNASSDDAHAVYCNVTAQRDIDRVAAVPALYHSSRSTAKRRVCGQVILMIGGRSEKWGPSWIRDVSATGQPDIGPSDSSHRTPCVVRESG